jgi:hypothetical protein
MLADCTPFNFAPFDNSSLLATVSVSTDQACNYSAVRLAGLGSKRVFLGRYKRKTNERAFFISLDLRCSRLDSGSDWGLCNSCETN